MKIDVQPIEDKLKKEASTEADKCLGEGENFFKSQEWFGFYYGYIWAKQQK